MNLNDYQQISKRTLIDCPELQLSDEQIMTLWNAIGLAGESGEVCDLVKKGIFHQHGLDMEKLSEELGDVLWYLSALCSTLDISLEDVAQININKLKERYPNGFSSEGSKERRDENKTPNAEYGDLIASDEFIRLCKTGSFIDYDGYGLWSDGYATYGERIIPSDVAKTDFKPRRSFVLWFNR
jgi:NTP pyrophosphatase (non-canonical NTP hydrolase)